MSKHGNSASRNRREQLKAGTVINVKRKKSVAGKAVARKAKARAKAAAEAATPEAKAEAPKAEVKAEAVKE